MNNKVDIDDSIYQQWYLPNISRNGNKTAEEKQQISCTVPDRYTLHASSLELTPLWHGISLSKPPHLFL